jgi:plastocyanin
MTFLSRLTFGILLAAPLAIGCSGSSNSSTPGSGGSGGSGGGGGTGPDPSFMAVAPCSTEAAYTTTGTTITFPATPTDFNYAPKCLKVTAGASVTFNGEFAGHPLDKSEVRGTVTGNPIVMTNTGSTASFTFPTAGFYAYYCRFHGVDDGQYMDGVIWVK